MKYILKIIFLLFIVSACCDEEEPRKLSEDPDIPGTRLVDFKVTITQAEFGKTLIIYFWPKISSEVYSATLYVPRFEFDPGNHRMPDDSYWFDLFDGLALSLYADDGTLISEHVYDTKANKARGVQNTSTHHYFGLGMGWELDRDSRYRMEVTIPDFTDPMEILPEMHLAIANPTPKFRL